MSWTLCLCWCVKTCDFPWVNSENVSFLFVGVYCIFVLTIIFATLCIQVVKNIFMTDLRAYMLIHLAEKVWIFCQVHVTSMVLSCKETLLWLHITLEFICKPRSWINSDSNRHKYLCVLFKWAIDSNGALILH